MKNKTKHRGPCCCTQTNFATQPKLVMIRPTGSRRAGLPFRLETYEPKFTIVLLAPELRKMGAALWVLGEGTVCLLWPRLGVRSAYFVPQIVSQVFFVVV